MADQAILTQAQQLANDASALALRLQEIVIQAEAAGQSASFLQLFTAFVLACVIGYYVVWAVTPALHSPLMGVTNAISSVIIVGALIAAGPSDLNISKIFGFIAVVLASVNIFGGFIVTHRMLSMFKKKEKK
ncbi:MAG: NAD(P) transhydrogenase subunit alpha [Alphaproteobacteria bacterium]